MKAGRAGKAEKTRRSLPALAAVIALSTITARPSTAQTDPSGPWRTWHTPHFRVHARAPREAVALRAAAEAERAYAALAAELTPPRGTIDLTLHDNTDFTNGFALAVPSNRIAIYAVPPAGSAVLGHYDDWLRVILTHELVHLFHLDRSRGVWRLAQRVFGRVPGSFPNAYQPAWVSEGLATYYESRLTGAGRLRGGLHSQLLAAAARDRWPLPGDATLASPQWPGGFLPYAWGSYFFDHIAATGGDSVVPRFVERTAGQLWPYGVSGAVQRSGGPPVREGWEQVRAQWEAAGGTAGGGGITRTLVRGLRAEPRPRLSPDGRLLAYVHADHRTDTRLVVLEWETGRTVATHRINAGVDVAWTDTAALIAAQLEYRNAAEVRSSLYHWDVRGGWRSLPGTGRLARPFAVRDGVAAAVDVESDATTVVTVGEDGTRHALSVPGGAEWSRLAASPDGAWMAGALHDGRRWDIVTWPAGDPLRVAKVTDDDATDDDPRWTPDGTGLLFTSERLGLPQVFEWRPADRVTRQITNEPAGARDGSVAPGGWLVYVTMLPDGFAVAVGARTDVPPAVVDRRAPVMAPRATRVEVPPVSARRTAYSAWPSLRPHFWLPTWHDAGTAGRFGGALITGVDAVGRAAYLARLAAAPDRGRFEGALAVVYSRWRAASLDLGYELEWSPRIGVVQPTGQSVALALVEDFATAGLTLRWRRWRSALSVRLGGELELEGLVNDSPLNLQLGDRPDFGNGVISLTAYHTSTSPLAISLENGAVFSALYRRRVQLGGAGWSHEVRGTLNGYWALPLPGFARWVLAGRVAGGVSAGPNRAVFDVGGESGDLYALLPGYAIGSGRRQFQLRGYDEMSGFDQVMAGGAELRIPLVLVARGIGTLPIGVDRISIAVFGEGARARLASGTRADFRDAGAEVVLDLGVSYDVPLRLRVGGALPLTFGLGGTRRAPRWYATFGSAF